MSKNDLSPLTRSVPLWWDTSRSPRFLGYHPCALERYSFISRHTVWGLTTPTSREAMCSPWSSYIIMFHTQQRSESTHEIDVLWQNFPPDHRYSFGYHPCPLSVIRSTAVTRSETSTCKSLYPIIRRRSVLFTGSPLQFQMVTMKYEGFEGEN